jgi:hypothetical protein
MISPVHGFFVFHSTDQIVHHLRSTAPQGKLVQETLAVTFAKDQTQALNIPVKVPLGGGRYAELTEWNGSKRVGLRFWETDTIPTKYGVSLSLSQWKVLCSATQVVDNLISRVKDEEPVELRFPVPVFLGPG